MDIDSDQNIALAFPMPFLPPILRISEAVLMPNSPTTVPRHVKRSGRAVRLRKRVYKPLSFLTGISE